MKPCAIVILNYNGEETMRTFLPSVAQQSSYDICVIDNGSTDNSREFLAGFYPEIRLILLPENLGYAGGYNWGLEQLKDEYQHYILLNSDVEVTARWDEKLIHWLEENPEFAAVQPKILSWQDKSKFDYAGAGGGFLDGLAYPYCRGRIWDSIEEDRGQYDDSIQVDWASGACMAIKSSIFHFHSGFDAHFFAHMEEIDLCWRMRKSGWKIGYHGASTVYHQGGATLERSSPKKLYLNIRNSLSMIYKNQTAFKFWFIFLVKFLLEMLAVVDYRVNGKPELADAIKEGYSDFWNRKENLEKVKQETKAKRPVRSVGPISMIFFQWKILGRKSYSQL